MGSTLSDRLATELRKTVDGEVFTDAPTLDRYSTTQGWYRIKPLAVLHPRSPDDVARAVAVCSSLGLPLIPRGAGTGLSGHGIGLGLVVDLSVHLNRIIEVGPDTVTVEPGVVLEDLNTELARHGKWFPIDPTSASHCTIGGMIATNAAGWHGPMYGATKDHVDSITVVLADGSHCMIGTPSDGQEDSSFFRLRASLEQLLRPHEALIRQSFPRVSKNSSGYNLVGALDMTPLDVRKLVVGSEGTLGVAVGATLRTAQLPAATGGLLVSGSGYEPLVRLLQALPPGGYAAAEIMDASFLVHGDFPPEWTEPGGSTLLYVDVHARSESELSSLLRDADKAAKKMSGIRSIPMSSESERKTLFQCRQRASERINMDQDRWKASFIEDGTVPLEHLAEYLGFMGELLRARGIRYALYGHAADGNIHCSPFIDIRNLDHYRMIDEIAFLVAEKIAELGGTLSGEHGDGFVRTPFLRGVYGSGVYSLFTGVKRLFDPQGRFHPGIIVGPQNASIAHDLRFE